MMVIYDTTVGAYRNVYAGLFEIPVAFRTDLDDCCCLPAANALGLARDADGAAADADLDKVCAALCKKAETCRIYNISCADLYAVSIVLADPGKCKLLPVGMPFRRVDAENVDAYVKQSGDTSA